MKLPTHRVRRCFLIACIVTIVSFLGLSVRLLSSSHVVNFHSKGHGRADENSLRHPQHRLKPSAVFVPLSERIPDGISIKKHLPQDKVQGLALDPSERGRDTEGRVGHVTGVPTTSLASRDARQERTRENEVDDDGADEVTDNEEETRYEEERLRKDDGKGVGGGDGGRDRIEEDLDDGEDHHGVDFDSKEREKQPERSNQPRVGSDARNDDNPVFGDRSRDPPRTAAERNVNPNGRSSKAKGGRKGEAGRGEVTDPKQQRQDTASPGGRALVQPGPADTARKTSAMSDGKRLNLDPSGKARNGVARVKQFGRDRPAFDGNGHTPASRVTPVSVKEKPNNNNNNDDDDANAAEPERREKIPVESKGRLGQQNEELYRKDDISRNNVLNDPERLRSTNEKNNNRELGNLVGFPQNISVHSERLRHLLEQIERQKAERRRVSLERQEVAFKGKGGLDSERQKDVQRMGQEDDDRAGQKGSLPGGREAMVRTGKDPDTEHPSSSDKGLDEDGNRGDSCLHCFHSNFPILMDHHSYCQALSDRTLVLLLISSAPANDDKRQAIRQTWGSGCQDRDSPHRCLFVLGQSRVKEENDRLEEENRVHGDILQFGFRDAYSNLTYKTLMSLRWADSHCPHVPYTMKTDDDMYVNTPLVSRLLTATPTSRFVGGFCWGRSSPNRDSQSKWFVPFRTFGHAQFPPMCSGTGYIMSRDVVGGVLAASENIPFFHLEDVYVALCLQTLGIRPLRIVGFNNMFTDFQPCAYRHRVMTSHQVAPHLLTQFWEQAQQCPGELASGEQLFATLPYPPTN